MGESKTRCSASVSSTTPRLGPRWPPVRETFATRKSRISAASTASSSGVSRFRSCGPPTVDSRPDRSSASLMTRKSIGGTPARIPGCGTFTGSAQPRPFSHPRPRPGTNSQVARGTVSGVACRAPPVTRTPRRRCRRPGTSGTPGPDRGGRARSRRPWRPCRSRSAGRCPAWAWTGLRRRGLRLGGSRLGLAGDAVAVGVQPGAVAGCAAAQRRLAGGADGGAVRVAHRRGRRQRRSGGRGSWGRSAGRGRRRRGREPVGKRRRFRLLREGSSRNAPSAVKPPQHSRTRLRHRRRP